MFCIALVTLLYTGCLVRACSVLVFTCDEVAQPSILLELFLSV